VSSPLSLLALASLALAGQLFFVAVRLLGFRLLERAGFAAALAGAALGLALGLVERDPTLLVGQAAAAWIIWRLRRGQGAPLNQDLKQGLKQGS
jgi:hypothetical protein